MILYARSQSTVSPFVSVQRVRRWQETAADIAREFGAPVLPVLLEIFYVCKSVSAEFADELFLAFL